MRLHIIITLAVLTVSASCSTGEKKKTTAKATVRSAPYELLIVGDKGWLDTTNGTVFMENINPEMEGLPQSESCFKVLSINPYAFKKSYRSFANIIVFDIDRKYKKAEMRTARDVYARPQTVVYLTAPDGRAMADLAEDEGYHIMDVFVQSELRRERGYLEKRHSTAVLNQVKSQFGCTLYVPENINAVKTGTDFMWASSNTEDNRLNICVYSYPFTAGEDFSVDRFIAHRDTFMQRNIRGGEFDQYMSMNRDLVFSRNITCDGHFVHEVRGLWRMENDMMGGPFVSYTQVDTLTNRVIVTEGFVYAPEKKKRQYIRELEAALQTLKMTGNRK